LIVQITAETVDYRNFAGIAIVGLGQKLSPLVISRIPIPLSLVGEDLHTYTIMREVEQQTEGRAPSGPGTLYISIRGLLKESLMEEVDAPQDSSGRL
jgi:hypothetical protein